MLRPGFITALLAVLMAGSVRGAAPVEPADEGDSCLRARALLGADAAGRDMTPSECQQALDAAEEERWQLWLDSAAADELTGDHERAALTLERLVRSVERRTSRLPAQWVVVRDEARATMARLDAGILVSKGRVTLATNPSGAEVTVPPAVAASLPERQPKTPLTAYFAPGTHTVRLLHRESDRAREVSFTVTAGRAIELHVELGREVPPEQAVRERPAELVLGRVPTFDPDAPTDLSETSIVPVVPGSPVSIDDVAAPEPGDAPPIHESGTSLAASLGTFSIAAGSASVAVGVVLAMIGAGLDDEAACGGAACDQYEALRAQVRRDADVSWDRATGTFVAGGVLIAGGVIALLLDDDDPASTVRPWLGPDGGGMSGAVRF